MDKSLKNVIKLALLTVLLLMPVFAQAAKKAWVEYQADTQTLTFHYDKLMDISTATAKYELNSDENKPGWVSDNDPKKNVTTVVFNRSFSDARPTTTAYWFWTFTNLTKIVGIENLNTSCVTNMAYMFYRCTSLTELDLSHFDTSNVTTMEEMLSALPLTSIDLSNFNTSKVTSLIDQSYANAIKMSPYRAYIAAQTSSAKAVSLDIMMDETDGISDINANDTLQLLDNAELYDAQGRRLSSPERGLVIIKKGGITRKMIVK